MKNIERPNILFVITDQQRKDSISAYGSDWVDTPHLDDLARRGVLFNRAYCANPVCTPARASMMTGLYPSEHGAWNIGTYLSRDHKTIADHLSEAGYASHYIGKSHLEPQSDPKSGEYKAHWKNGAVHDGPFFGYQGLELTVGHSTAGVTGHYRDWVREKRGEAYLERLEAKMLCEEGYGAIDWNMETSLHNSMWIADRARAFIREHAAKTSSCGAPQAAAKGATRAAVEQSSNGDEPFFLTLSFQDPHAPHALPTDYKKRVKDDLIPMKRYTSEDLLSEPEHFRFAHEGRLKESEVWGRFGVTGQGKGANFSAFSQEDAHPAKSYYYEMCHIIDDALGEVIKTLEELEMRDNTLIIFTTDHGELLGDHGLWEKGPFLYEELVNIPMIMSWPKGLEAQGVTSECLASQIDVLPTCLKAAGCEVPSEVSGLSLLDLLSEKAKRDWLAVEFLEDLGKTDMTQIISKDDKTVFYEDVRALEFRDLRNDPKELRNHAEAMLDSPRYRQAEDRKNEHRSKRKLENFSHRPSYA